MSTANLQRTEVKIFDKKIEFRSDACTKDVLLAKERLVYDNKPAFIARILRFSFQRRQSHFASISALLFSFFANSGTQKTLKPLPFCFKIVLSISALAVASCAFSDAGKNTKRLLLAGFLETLATRQLALKF